MKIYEHTENRLALIKAIRRSGPVSHSELIKLTGLSSGLITLLTNSLLGRNLITERRETTKRAGRPRNFLEINADAAIAIGASIIGSSELLTSFVDLSGKELFATSVPYGSPASLLDFAHTLANALDMAIGQSPYDRTKISQIGIAMPAIVDGVRGIVHRVTTFSGEPVNFAELIGDRLSIPVTIETEGASIARAEHWFGSAQHLDSFNLIHLGMGVTCGVYRGDIPSFGANGINSQIAHVTTDYSMEARPCFCGGRGCLTAYSSMRGVVEPLGLIAKKPFPNVLELPIAFQTVLDRADRRDGSAIEQLRIAGHHLGLAVANLINADDPGSLLITALDQRFLDHIEPHFTTALKAHALPSLLAITDIRLLAINEDWRGKGTAALALEMIYLAER